MGTELRMKIAKAKKFLVAKTEQSTLFFLPKNVQIFGYSISLIQFSLAEDQM